MNEGRLRRAGRGCAALLALSIVGPSALAEGEWRQDVASAGEPTSEAGKQIYRSGVLPSGEPLRATVEEDVEVKGSQAACASCHGRSGLGFSEADRVPLAITAPVLFRSRTIERPDLYASRTEGEGTRPAYTSETLGRAIREGVDSAGRPLDPLMPRYAVGDDELEPLLAYLRTLGMEAPPGLTDEVIHVGTVVAGDVDTEQRRAMLEVLEAYFRSKNAETRRETIRARARMLHKEWHYRAYREWVLHVWELEGSRESWPAQLEERYAEQPVFALVSGLAAGDWGPISGFCEAREIPCLLPNTDLPPAADAGFYSIFFSEGVALEAKVLARHLADRPAGRRIVQVYRDGEAGSVASGALKRALEAQKATVVEDRRAKGSQPIDADFLARQLEPGPPAVLVLWLSEGDLESLGALEGAQGLEEIYLSSSLAAECTRLVPAPLRDRTFCIRPFALPDQSARQLRPTRAWLKVNGIEMTQERIQVDTFFAVRTLGEALRHVVGNFSREYVVEKVEHRLSSTVTPSSYPEVSLASGQRFASKGAYIVQPSAEAESGMTAVTDWIVP